LQHRFFICLGRILIISLSPLIKKFKTNGWVSQLFIVALIGFCARAGLKSVAGGLSVREWSADKGAECPSNFLRTTLFFVEKGEKEKHRRPYPFARSVGVRAIENFGFISAQSFIAWIYVRGRSATLFCRFRSEQFCAVCGAGRARTPKYGGGIKRIFIYEMKPQTEIAAGIKGN
jgi:hypothetical protein